MGTCFLHGNGGGAALNFKVVGGTTKPGSPAANTIWVNTETAVTSWCISPAAPSSPTAGMVWLMNDTRSAISLNALKKNSIMIWPLSAKQYTGSAWVDKSSMIYQGSAWKDFIDWSKFIVKDGISNLDVHAIGKKWDSSFSETTFTVTQGDGYIQFSHTSSSTGMVYWGPFDLTDAETLTIEGSFSGTCLSKYPTYYNLSVWSSIGTYVPTNRVKYKQLTATGASVDVTSLTGTYYVGYSVRDSGTEKVTNFFIE